MISLATYSTIEYTDTDRKRWAREEMERLNTILKDLFNALSHKGLVQRYGIWRDYFWDGDYEDYGPIIEYPEFVKDYEFYIQKELQRIIKGAIK